MEIEIYQINEINEIQYFMENRSAFLDFKKYYAFSSLLTPLHPFYIIFVSWLLTNNLNLNKVHG